MFNMKSPTNINKLIEDHSAFLISVPNSWNFFNHILNFLCLIKYKNTNDKFWREQLMSPFLRARLDEAGLR